MILAGAFLVASLAQTAVADIFPKVTGARVIACKQNGKGFVPGRMVQGKFVRLKRQTGSRSFRRYSAERSICSTGRDSITGSNNIDFECATMDFDRDGKVSFSDLRTLLLNLKRSRMLKDSSGRAQVLRLLSCWDNVTGTSEELPTPNDQPNPAQDSPTAQPSPTASPEFTITPTSTPTVTATSAPAHTPVGAGRMVYVDPLLTSTPGSGCQNGSYSAARRDCTGSDGVALADLQQAVCSLQPGDVLQVRGGNYPCVPRSGGNCAGMWCFQDTPVITVQRSGTQQAPIVIEGFEDETVTVVGASLSGSPYYYRYGILVTGDYVTLNKLSVAKVGRWGMALRGKGNVITYSLVYDNSNNGGWDGGISIEQGAEDFLIDSVVSKNNGMGIAVGHPTNNGSNWIYYNPSDPLHSVVADRNTRQPLSTNPVFVKNGTIRNSLIYDNTSCSENSDGIGGAYTYNISVIDNVIIGSADDNLDFIGSVENRFIGNISLGAGDMRPYNGGGQCAPGGGGDGSGIKVNTRGGGGDIIVGNIAFNNANRGYDNDDGQGDIYINNIGYGNGIYGFLIENQAHVNNFVTGSIMLNNIAEANGGIDNFQSSNPFYWDSNIWSDGQKQNDGPLTLSGSARFASPPPIAHAWQAYRQYLNMDPNDDGVIDFRDVPLIRSAVRSMFALSSSSPARQSGVDVINLFSQMYAQYQSGSMQQSLLSHALSGLPSPFQYTGSAPDRGAFYEN